MSLKMRDFECLVCGTIKEKLTQDSQEFITCDCGGTMKRKLSAPQGKGNFAHGMLKPKFNK